MKTRNIFFTVVCLVGFAGVTATVFVTKTSVLKSVTKSGADSVARRMKAYFRKHDEFPSFEQIRVQLNGEPETILQDAWGRKFKIENKEKFSYVRSAGLDGKYYTEDDMVVTIKKPNHSSVFMSN